MPKRRATCTLLFALCLLAAPARGGEERLRVMLQGDSSDKLAELVTLRGGTVTHRLHIIDAVGALVTRDQLDTLVQSPLVTRHIDDLSILPPEKEQDDCNVGGALELDIEADRLQWRLYNKGARDPVLSRVEFQWPERLGILRKARLGDVDLPLPEGGARPGDTPLVIAAETEGEIPLGERSVLELRFEGADRAARPPRQNEITLEAHFAGGCRAELIPGYRRYGDDTYYPTVAGAASLHRLGITGDGVTVAVLDSGLWEHHSLTHNTRGEYRVRGRYDAIRDIAGEEVFDESGHGTHMTSVIAHSDPVNRPGAKKGSFMGIAPDVQLVEVKAFNRTGQGDFLDIVRGIQWVVDHREALDIRILNLSFAARPRWPYWLDPINQAVMRAWRAGIVVVAAAGNEGPEAMSVGSPGNLPYIVTVGAVTDSWTPGDRRDDYIPDFSSRGPTPSAHIKPDLVAPGGHIAGITRPGSTLTLEHPDYLLSTGEFVMTGTSQASALVSGIAALLLQLEPELTPDEVKCKLMSSAELAINRDGKLAYSPFQQGSGYVSASRAVTLGQRDCGNPEMDLDRDIAGEEHYEGPAIVDEAGKTTLPGLTRLYDGIPSAKGYSDTRRWGVKAHIERRDGEPSRGSSPVDWLEQYLAEKRAIDALSKQSRESRPGPD